MNSRMIRLFAAVAVLVVGWWLLPAPAAAFGSAWSVLPPVLAIFLALWARQVVASLFLGVWLGTTMLAGDPGRGFLRLVDTNLREALTDPDHVSILLFSMLLGGMVAVMSRSGGTAGVVGRLEPLATTPRRSQIVTWLMGVAIFFDDYSNTLVVGHAMRPVTDRHRVSREKLAFLVDSTAAPVACVAVVSTWVGYQVSVLGDALQANGADLNPFSVFLASVPAAFYPFAALALTFSVAVSRRDMGPMLKAERRAAAGVLLADQSRPLADFDTTALEPEPETPRRWFNAALPVLSVVVVMLVGLWVTGRASLEADGAAAAGLAEVIGASDPFTVLLWGSLVGLTMAIVLAIGQGLLTLEESMDAMVAGFRSMLIAVVVLTLAWSLGRVCTDLGTADWLTEAVGPHVPVVLLPGLVFVVAAAVSFSTGTSWGTMAILTPLAVPLILRAAPESGPLLSVTVSAILGGSVFGDHCSPISDTTVMSSMASSCDHVDHVRTQLPYALLAAGAALVLGYVPSCVFGLSLWVTLPLTIAGVVAVFMLLSSPVDDHDDS
ncbi:MAG: Na+/H+ antiporter NhaC family protein [Acidobacteria bacterium]|nr:MAG: Na+/H+ antiporter NhaC family protein [Acidobacteriota bacterium]